ncbi:hypothetical protein Tco_1108107 [Tanacetum coccineum]
MDLTKAGENRFLQINELDKMRLDAYETSISCKERTKRWHDKRIKVPSNYEKGDTVLLFNSRLRLFPRKLKSRWYGPFLPYPKNLLDTNRDDDVALDDEKKEADITTKGRRNNSPNNSKMTMNGKVVRQDNRKPKVNHVKKSLEKPNSLK